MLGFPSGVAVDAYSLYGTAPSGNDFVLDDLGCTGSESSIFDCPHLGEWSENCGASEIAGVQCAAPWQAVDGLVNEMSSISGLVSDIADLTDSLARVRLGGTGSSARKGYVEAYGSNGQWGGVCDDYFDDNDATVVCQMLGFPSGVAVDAYSLYGTAPSGNDFVLDDLGCTGSESSIFDCPHLGEWSENCGASEIAGVQCAAPCTGGLGNEHVKNIMNFGKLDSVPGWTVTCGFRDRPGSPPTWQSSSPTCTGWWCYNDQNGGIGVISTTLEGSGHIDLDYGICYGDSSSHIVIIYLDDIEISRAVAGEDSKVASFDFTDGSVLRIQEESTSIFQLNSITICTAL